MTQAPTTRTAPSDGADRGWLVLAHLSQFVSFVGIPSFLGPLGIWLIKGRDDARVAREAKEALNFALSLLLYLAVLIALLVMGILNTTVFDGGISVLMVAIFGWIAMALGSLVLPVVAAVRTTEAVPYRYPFTIRFFDADARA